MRRLTATLLLLALAAAARAELKISGATQVKPYQLARLTAEGADPKAGVIWRVSPSKDVSKASGTGKGKLEFVAPPGDYTVDVLSVRLGSDGSTVVEEAQASVTIGEPGPDPGPGPGPTPPAPQGFRVLVVYETSMALPQAQANVLYSTEVRDYLQSKCVSGADGKTKEWRVWDKDVDTSAEGKFWQDAMKVARTSTPWLQVYSGGKLVHSAALPADVAGTLAVLKKYGG